MENITIPFVVLLTFTPITTSNICPITTCAVVIFEVFINVCNQTNQTSMLQYYSMSSYLLLLHVYPVGTCYYVVALSWDVIESAVFVQV